MTRPVVHERTPLQLNGGISGTASCDNHPGDWRSRAMVADLEEGDVEWTRNEIRPVQ
jgi:hypothetical protein